MTLRSLIKKLLKQGFSGNEIQKILPSYGLSKRRQDLQKLIREIRGIKKKLSSKPWEGLPQPVIKPRSKLEHWKRAVSTSSKYINIFYNYYATFYASWIDERSMFQDHFFTKFLSLMSYNMFKKNKNKLIEKAISEIQEDMVINPDYETKDFEDIQEITLIEIFRHKAGILK